MTLSIKAGSTVLFIGDSITEWGRDDAAGSLGHGYVRMAADGWAAAHPEHPITVINKGIGGNRAVDLRERWTRDAIDVAPDVVTIMVGINDTWRRFDADDATSTESYETDLRFILGRLAAETSAQVLFIEPFVLPVLADQWEWREDLDARIAVVRRVAAETGATLLAADGLLTELAVNAGGNSGGETRGFARYADDGVHLTDEGNAELAAAWLARTEAI
ncbi:Lysophospholipase L1 [Sanguibacter gelidistatuariae]|uniref:Lysophospholipase L1 n=1 Tax=Sanguibacter gelidistatuariae TaxID=1814289 RepID=A0A1G6UVI0_9MICO|nr:SGNH/GDSL hydrolase family protein [Sanguibacter gelidistatuariae]SDD44565.1 Lysophospholipase L1 [Sanguibacter gelidistatuariae]